MITVSKDLLRENMLHYFELVEQRGEELVVMDNGVAVLKIIPIRSNQTAAEAFGDARGRVTWSENLTLPTSDEWPDC